jgi:hypothetical protein
MVFVLVAVAAVCFAVNWVWEWSLLRSPSDGASAAVLIPPGVTIQAVAPAGDGRTVYVIGSETTVDVRPLVAEHLPKAMFAVSGLLLLVSVRGVRRNAREWDRPRCGPCGYDLSGSPPDGSRCPECGAELPVSRRFGRDRVFRSAVWFAASVSVLAVGCLLASFGAHGLAERLPAMPSARLADALPAEWVERLDLPLRSMTFLMRADVGEGSVVIAGPCGITRPRQGFPACAVSPDGTRLIAVAVWGDVDSPARHLVWDVRTGAVIYDVSPSFLEFSKAASTFRLQGTSVIVCHLMVGPDLRLAMLEAVTRTVPPAGIPETASLRRPAMAEMSAGGVLVRFRDGTERVLVSDRVRPEVVGCSWDGRVLAVVDAPTGGRQRVLVFERPAK